MAAWDDVVYLGTLLAIIGTGHRIRQITNVNVKQTVSTVIGLFILFLVSGFYAFHPIFVTLINTAIVFLFKKHCHVISFAFCFTTLAVFRLAHMLEYIEDGLHHLNAIQMIHTLKMIGLAFEINDTFKHNKNDEKQLKVAYSKIDPSFLDIFHYAFCHVGLLTGPYFKFRTYWDWLHKPFSKYAPIRQMLIERVKIVPLYAVLLLIGNYFFPLEYAKSDIYTRSFWYRIWYLNPLFFNFRMRLYIAFVLSECCCIATGFGLYPASSKPKPGEGPTDFEELRKHDVTNEALLKQIEYSYETIHNIDEYGAEITKTAKGVLRTWNMTVQYWLATFVYKRVKVFRVAITMLTSAYWHGIYSGYYLGLLTVPFVLIAENSMRSAIQKHTSTTTQKICDYVNWFFRVQAFCYMGLGFFLVYSGDTFKYWQSIYFIGHILIAVFFLLGRLITIIGGTSKKDSMKAKIKEKKKIS